MRRASPRAGAVPDVKGARAPWPIDCFKLWLCVNEVFAATDELAGRYAAGPGVAWVSPLVSKRVDFEAPNPAPAFFTLAFSKAPNPPIPAGRRESEMHFFVVSSTHSPQLPVVHMYCHTRKFFSPRPLTTTT